MRKGDLVELSPRLANHGGRVVRIHSVERDWDGLNPIDRVHYEDPDGAVGEDGAVLLWWVASHLCIRVRDQRPDYAKEDADSRALDRVRTRTDAALKAHLQHLGLVPVPRRRVR